MPLEPGRPATRRVACPHCGAPAYAPCQRMVAGTYHQARVEAAREAKPGRLQTMLRAAERMFKP